MIDRIEIIAIGGNGGSGCVSFRREKFVPRGGPDGGDGGDGGKVILIADRSVRTLKELGRKRIYRAGRGKHGEGSDRHGRRGSDLVIRIPVGTEVMWWTEEGSWERLADLVEKGQQLITAEGGRGGWGNARFSSSTHRAPRIAQRGQAGRERRVRLDLKLLADVGLVGMPNAGKSTLLRAMSEARPKVAAYPFTTIEPVLGVVNCGWERFVVADMPGLIEGAHSGVGLGLDFLRHIERTKLILHLVDGAAKDPLRDLILINEELRQYGMGLEDRRQLVVVSKIDQREVKGRRKALERQFTEANIELTFLSGATGEGVEMVTLRLAELLRQSETASTVSEEVAPVVLRPHIPHRGVWVTLEDGGFRVESERAVVFAEMMPIEQEEARAELWRRFDRWGVNAAIRRSGAEPGDLIRLGQVELEWLA